MKEQLPQCKVDGCDNIARSFKGGICSKHEDRLRKFGDVNVNLYADRGQKWELPDGRIIRGTKKIENLNIIIERIKNTRLLGYETEYYNTLDNIEKVLDDYHGAYKNGERKRGKKTLTFAIYVDSLENSDWGLEHGLITLEQSKLISKIVSELSKSNTSVPFLDLCKNLEIESDADWLIQAFTKYPIIGITYNPEEKTIEFSKDLAWFYELAPNKNKLILSGVPDDAFKAGLHDARRLSYKEYVQNKTSKSTTST